MLGRVWEAIVPPLGCCLLMLLMICMELLGRCSQMHLHLGNIQEPWDGHLLLTHVLCAPDRRLLFLTLLIFPLLCSQLEVHMGTLCYLYLSCLCTLCSAALYIILSWLLPLSDGAAFGYLPTQLALLMSQKPTKLQPNVRRLSTLLSCGILVIAQLLCPLSPLLLHVCGLFSGLILRFGLLSCLELSEHQTRALERTKLYRCLASVRFVRMISSCSRAAVLPEMDPRAVERPFTSTEAYPSTLITNAPWAVLSEPSAPPLFGRAEELEEDLLRAGIQASLREYEGQGTESQELTLHKSSVSAFRLQQLERMGFPTGPAVVALAATGKVERAVSLLVEGQVGENILVTGERQTIREHQTTPEARHTNPFEH